MANNCTYVRARGGGIYIQVENGWQISVRMCGCEGIVYIFTSRERMADKCTYVRTRGGGIYIQLENGWQIIVRMCGHEGVVYIYK